MLRTNTTGSLTLEFDNSRRVTKTLSPTWNGRLAV